MNRALIEKLNLLIAPVLLTFGFELVGCEYTSRGRQGLLRVYIDAEDGVTLGDCEKASKQINALLDVEDLIEGRYTLEVSSPGLDRPLFTLEQCRRFIGHRLKVKLNQPNYQRRHFEGVLIDVEGDVIKLKVDNEIVQLMFANIDKANLIPEL